MIILNNTGDTLQIVLATGRTTNDLDIISTFRDITTTTFTPNKQLSRSNGTNIVSFISSPSLNSQRVIDYISINNSDTINHLVTINLNDGSNSYTLLKTIISPNEKIEYQEGVGFKVINTTGAVKQTITQGNNSITSNLSLNILGSDVINNNATANTMKDVTGLSFPVDANRTYYFKFIIDYTAAATTTGSRWSINGPSFSRLSYVSTYSLTTVSNTFNTCVAYDTPSASNTSSAVVAGNISIIEGIISTTNSGTIIARFASEVASSAITAKTGSLVYYQQII